MTPALASLHPTGCPSTRASVTSSRCRLPNRAACLFLLVLVLALSACGSLQRSPISEAEIARSAPYGVPGIVRVWGDSIEQAELDSIQADLVARTRKMHSEKLKAGEAISETVLALSGGGADGAFGAGLLAGWTERGDRPEFDVVTGVSTGAIIGLLAFLGPDYDDELKTFYTTYSTDQLLSPTPFAALTGGASLSDASGYHALIDGFVDDALVAELALEEADGRIFLVGTTNLDAARPVIWNITKIAASGHSNAKQLIRDIIRASSAIPAIFPPVVIPSVTPDGARFDEVHVDGGATQQVLLFSPELPIQRVDEAVGVKIDRTLYVVMNDLIKKPYEPVELGVLSIAGKSANSLISGSGSGDLYKIYAIAQRDDLDFKVLWIPKEFEAEPLEPFDIVYMSTLYDLGYDMGLSGGLWRSQPPDFQVGK